MRSQSKDIPATFRIKNIILDVATIRLVKNIEPYEDEETSGYRYDEVDLKLQDRPNLEDYITDNFEALYAQGEKEEMKPKVAQAKKFLNSTDWIFAKCFELGLDPATEYPDVITQRGEARELIRRYE